MSRIFIVITLVVSAAWLASCGYDLGVLYGSHGDIVDCVYKTIDCDLYPPAQHAIVIHYRTPLDTGGFTWTARIFIDTEGVEKVEGHKFEGDNFPDIVQITRPGGGEPWPEFSGNFCKINEGGDTADKKMSGKCAFAFFNGYFVTAEFSCTLKAVDQ